MTYLKFLQLLVALGPKFPALWVIVQEIVEKVQEAIRLITGAEPLFGVPFAESSAAEVAEEAKLASLTQASGLQGAGERGTLRDIWTFIKENPELLALILSLLKK